MAFPGNLLSHGEATLAPPDLVPLPSMQNFLIQITLLQSTRPVVSRLLSVPPLMTFYQLHEAIAVSFDYKNTDTKIGAGPVYPSFDVTNAVEAEKPIFHRKMGMSLLASARYDPIGKHEWDAHTIPIFQLFDEEKGFAFSDFRFRYYFHKPDLIEHSVQVLGNAVENSGGEIVCLGGQGSAALREWDSPGIGGGQSIRQRGPSTSELDLVAVSARLAKLQEGWIYTPQLRLENPPFLVGGASEG